MKKVISITISSVVFNVEDDAYEKLADYLGAIKKYFAKDKDGDEIVEDIETSIAEKFSKRKNKDAAITEKDVDGIIAEMGTLKDFKRMSEDKEDDDEEPAQTPVEKKLYRDPDDVIIAGVCSGLAAYFGLETVLVRIIFFITIFFGGFGIIAYLILWIVMPEAETTAQKAEMRGERLTLHEIEKTVKKEVDKFKKKDLSGVKHGLHKAEDFLKKFFPSSGRFLKQLLRLLSTVLGIALILASLSGVFAISFGLTWQLSGGTIPDTTYTFSDFIVVSPTVYLISMIALYLTMTLPLLLIFFLGLSFVKRSSVLSLPVLVLIVALWFASSGFVASIISQNHALIQQRIDEMKSVHQQEWEEEQRLMNE